MTCIRLSFIISGLGDTFVVMKTRGGLENTAVAGSATAGRTVVARHTAVCAETKAREKHSGVDSDLALGSNAPSVSSRPSAEQVSSFLAPFYVCEYLGTTCFCTL